MGFPCKTSRQTPVCVCSSIFRNPVFSWGNAIIKANGTPAVIQSIPSSQTLVASALGVLGVSTVGTNTITTLVKLNAGDSVSEGVGATSGIAVNLLSSLNLCQHFSGFLVK